MSAAFNGVIQQRQSNFSMIAVEHQELREAPMMSTFPRADWFDAATQLLDTVTSPSPPTGICDHWWLAADGAAATGKPPTSDSGAPNHSRDITWPHPALERPAADPRIDISPYDGSGDLAWIWEKVAERRTPADDQVPRIRIAERAVALADLLDLPSRKDRDTWAMRLGELLYEFPHGASHRAIGRLIAAGTEPEVLATTAELVREWRATPSLWLVRRWHRMERRYETSSGNPGARLAFGWTLGARIAQALHLDIAVDRIHGAWRSDWLKLGRDDPAFFSYTDFIGRKMESRRSAMLTRGLALLATRGEFQEAYDRHDWHRGLEPSLRAAIAPDGRPFALQYCRRFEPCVPATPSPS
jgi:hypothetical protein